MNSAAIISRDGVYRYSLIRVWNTGLPRVLYIMLNPSTADAKKDDPTIRSCIRLAAELGYGSLEVVNLFAFRATNPAELAKAADPVGPLNTRIVSNAVRLSSVVICAWGAHKIAEAQFVRMEPVIDRGSNTFCFGTCKGGAPMHPLYIKSGTPLLPYGLSARSD